MADASFLYSSSYLDVPVDFGGVVHRLTFTVLDVDCPLVLGMPFLRDCNPHVDWKLKVVSFPGVAPARASSCSNMFSALDSDVEKSPFDFNFTLGF